MTIASKKTRVARVRKGFLAGSIKRTIRLFGGTKTEKIAGPGAGKKKK